MVTYIFLLHNNSAHVILFNLKRKLKTNFSEGKKDIAESVHKIDTAKDAN